MKALGKTGVIRMTRSQREFKEEAMMEAQQHVAPSLMVVHDVCLSVCQSLDLIKVVLDGLSLSIIDEEKLNLMISISIV
jgi:hypothetical protein